MSSLLLLATPALPATRPHYGGVLRVEIRESFATPDSPEAQSRLAALAPGFTVSSWEPGRRAIFTAVENAAGGRPFVDSVEIQMGRPLRDQSIDFGLGKADIVELAPDDLRRPMPGRRVWSSKPVRVVALVFRERIANQRVREALAFAVDRTAIYDVLLQRRGEISGALLPQWLSGYAFLFPGAADLARAQSLAAAVPPQSRRFTLAADTASTEPLAQRIVLNARDAGLTVTLVPHGSAADARLVEARLESADPNRALGSLASALGLPAPPRAETPEALYEAESFLLAGCRVVPLFHLPEAYGVSLRVRGASGVTPSGDWRFQNLWLESSRP